MCMKPWPILQQSLIDSSGVTVCDVLVRNCEPNLTVQTYSHMVKVLVKSLGDLMGELATGYRQTGFRPVQRMNLMACG